MKEYIKLDPSKIKLKGLTKLDDDGKRVGLLTLSEKYPDKCVVLFVELDHWEEIAGRIYAEKP